MRKNVNQSIILSLLVIGLFSCSESVPTAPSEPKDNTIKSETSAKPSVEVDKKLILFFGNSLTAAYGIDPEEGFVQLIQEKIDALGKEYKTVNAGLSGETTAGGKNRIDWILKNNKIDIFVLELGGNDGLRGIDPAASMANLEVIIQRVQQKNPQTRILLAGMEAPPNMGEDYTKTFRNIYPALAARYKLELIPFLLDGVGGNPELNLKDGIHPNEAGQKIVAENIWTQLKTMIN